MPVETPGETIKVGVCMPSTGPWAELSRFQVLGIRTAGQVIREKTGRNVELIFRDPGESPSTFSGVVQKLLMDEHVSGIISCASADEVLAAQNVLSRKPVPFIVTSPCRSTLKSREDLYGIRICSTLDDQAYACARFLSDKLKARRIGLVVDVEDPVMVKIASLFSSELTRMSGRIVGIAYVKKGKDPKALVTHLMEAGPEAIYMPFAGEHQMVLIEKVHSSDADMPVLINTYLAEETLLGEAAKALEGVYIQTDFIEEAVRSSLGREFIEYYRRHTGRKIFLGSSVATGAEGYFLMLDMISEVQGAKVEDAVQKAASWKGSLLGFTGVTSKGAVYPQLAFGRIEKRFLGGTKVTFVAAITLNRSDPVADTGAQ